MEMRRHFGAKAKEKEAKDDFSSRLRESVDRHTPGSKVHDAYKFIKVQIYPKRLPYLHYYSLNFL